MNKKYNYTLATRVDKDTYDFMKECAKTSRMKDAEFLRMLIEDWINDIGLQWLEDKKKKGRESLWIAISNSKKKTI